MDWPSGLSGLVHTYIRIGHRGTAHESIVPYQAFKCKDGKYMVGAGNDKQVRRVGLSEQKEWGRRRVKRMR
jgi:crotonobetainyl-CoA:carnitine CoA-transferase CaiB-like acyl-CoA transferase